MTNSLAMAFQIRNKARLSLITASRPVLGQSSVKQHFFSRNMSSDFKNAHSRISFSSFFRKNFQRLPAFGKRVVQNPQISRVARLAVAGGAPAVIAGSMIYAYYTNLIREKHMASAFTKGAVPEPVVGNLIERQNLSHEIATILQPSGEYNKYDMIVGCQGVGKTTIVRHVAHQLSGVIYIDIEADSTSNEDFGNAFAKAMKWSKPSTGWGKIMLEKLHIAQKEKEDPELRYKRVFQDFQNHAANFKKSHGRCAVLIIDNVNRLAADNPKLLASLQDRAKDAADYRRFTVVFVTSEGLAPLQMLGRSAKSRLGQVKTVGDLTYPEVVKFLHHKDYRDPKVVEKVYSLVSGRIALIESVVNMLDKNVDWAVVQSQILIEAKKDFENAGFLERGQARTAALQIIRHILSEGKIHSDKFLDITGTKEQKMAYLSYNIFVTVPQSEWISFHSKPAEIVARQLVTNIATAGKFGWGWWGF